MSTKICWTVSPHIPQNLTMDYKIGPAIAAVFVYGIYTPAPPKVEWGYTGFTPMSVHPSVRPSVDKVSGTFLKNLLAQFISYLAFTLMGWVSWPLFIFVILASFLALWWPNIWSKMGFPELFEKTIGPIHFIPGIYPYGVSFLTPIHFRFPSLILGRLVAKYLAENGVSGIFWKKLLAQFISYLAFTRMGWVSWPLYIFVLLASFLALWWPNIWPKMGFPELFEKTIGSIHFIPGIYPYGVSL